MSNRKKPPSKPKTWQRELWALIQTQNRQQNTSQDLPKAFQPPTPPPHITPIQLDKAFMESDVLEDDDFEIDEPIFSVSGALERLNHLLEVSYGRIGIRGEISNLAKPRSGHLYFRLKDATGVISAAFFKPKQKKMLFPPKDEMDAICWGTLQVYPPQGRLQFVVEELEEVGRGPLAAAFQALKERLEEEGLFEESHKKPLPSYPKRIGLICSPTGAALRDIIHVLKRRSPETSLLLAPSQVQGEGAPAQLTSAIRALNRQEDIDLIILGRGGGSLEDLWAFNEEEVARAIYTSRIPIISGVGHQTDFTIADFVADHRAPTPSAAAELAVPDREMLQQELHQYSQRLQIAIRHTLESKKLQFQALSYELQAPHRKILSLKKGLERYEKELRLACLDEVKSHKQKLQHYQSRLEELDPSHTLRKMREQWLVLSQRLSFSQQQILERHRHRLAQLAGRLQALSPLSILERGYGLVYDENKSLLRSSSDAEQGQQLRIRLHQGELDVRVEKCHPEKPSE